MQVDQPEFWLAVAQIIWINVLLSGDNAVVIALACRSLAGRARWWGMALGSGAAVVLRIVFTGIITTLMTIPYLKIVGAFALLYIAIDLIRPKAEDAVSVGASESLWRAVITIVVADLVMSLDNVIAIAAVAHGSWIHLIIGLGISIPLIVSGSFLIVTLLDRFPVLMWAGAALLGWIAGEMVASDVAAIASFGPEAANYELPGKVIGAAVVLACGLWLTYGRRPRPSPPPD